MDQFQGTSGGTKLRGNLLTQLHLKNGSQNRGGGGAMTMYCLQLNVTIIPLLSQTRLDYVLFATSCHSYPVTLIQFT